MRLDRVLYSFYSLSTENMKRTARSHPVPPKTSQNSYIMRDQARDTVHQIMHERCAETLLTSPSWLAFVLLLVAFNIITITAP
jgi:hypothetical protein